MDNRSKTNEGKGPHFPSNIGIASNFCADAVRSFSTLPIYEQVITKAAWNGQTGCVLSYTANKLLAITVANRLAHLGFEVGKIKSRRKEPVNPDKIETEFYFTVSW